MAIYFRNILTLIALVLNGCLFNSNYGNAKLLEKGKVEFRPSYSGAIFATKREEIEGLDVGIKNFGFNAGYGVSESSNINLQYEYISDLPDDFSFPNGSRYLHTLKLEPKYSGDRKDYIAYGLPIKYYVDANVLSVGLIKYFNFYPSDYFFFSLSPSIQFYFQPFFEMQFPFIQGHLNSSFNVALSKNISIIGEVGVDGFALLLASIVGNFGAGVSMQF